MKHDDVTLVLQGPTVSLSGRLGASFKNIENYYKHVSKIVVSTWSNYKTKPSSSMLKKFNISYIEDNIDRYADYYNDANIAYQCISSLNGMDLVTTKYTIKARCDEKYTDLSKFIEVMKSSPDKLTTNNFLFVNDDWLQFHPSDHVMGGLTTKMAEMFELAYDRCYNHEVPMEPGSEYAPEHLLRDCFDGDNVWVSIEDFGDFVFKIQLLPIFAPELTKASCMTIVPTPKRACCET